MTSLNNLEPLINCQLGTIRFNQWPVFDILGYNEAALTQQALLLASMNLNMSASGPHSVFQISQPPDIAQKWFCIQNLEIDISFQKKQTV